MTDDELKNPNWETLKPWASTALQIRLLKACIEHGTMKKAAKALEIPYHKLKNNIASIKRKAAKQGWSPDHDYIHPVPDSFAVKRISNYYNRDGKPAGGWVIAEPKKEDLQRLFEEFIEAAKEDLPQKPPRPATQRSYSDDYLAFYPIGDHHTGMYAWKDETGEDYDLNIAERLLCGAMEVLVDSVIPCEQSVIAVMGDYFHADNATGMTPKGGHILDTDSRFTKVVRIGFKMLIQCVDTALSRHRSVTVYVVPGNHDPNLARMLAVALSFVYANEARVTVAESPTVRHYHRFGNSLIGLTHSDKERDKKDLPLIMANERREEWAECRYFYWFHGHLHTDMKFELGGVTVEGLRILPPKDAWHTEKGYISGRDMKAVVYHRKYGERGRHTAPVALIEDYLNDSGADRGENGSS